MIYGGEDRAQSKHDLFSFTRRDGVPTVGGQAVIEGVMMRSPNRLSLAVRKPDGEIETRGWDFAPLSKRNKFLGLPIVRGVGNLAEMLYWGMKTLQISGQIALGKGAQTASKSSQFMSSVSLVLGVLAGVLLFAYLPLFSAGLLGLKDKPLLFNLFAGAIRILLFIIYIFLISLMKDVHRLFQYHGAEHKTIHAFERGDPLVVERVQKYSTHHPRCGTSFILIVALFAILIFAMFDGLLYMIWRFAPAPIVRLPLHILLLPILAGISYEGLKISDKLSQRSAVARAFISPGLWLQKITTKSPDNGMVEVAVVALMDSIKNISIGGNNK